jgi:catechol 2,3-dioxygenase-like lactoylglutathione lyase family enzyme
MKISGIRFIMIASTDLAASVAFYRDTLQLPLAARFENFAFFDANGVTLALSGDLAQNGFAPGTSSEIVFGVDGVRGAFEELRAAGVDFINEPRAVNDGAWAVNLRDPDGHLLSLYGDP